MKVSFFGAAREVTGSCYLFETERIRFLVDCGMFQGGHEASARNKRPFQFDARTLDFVLLTHAHIDHSGLLPKLTRAGFTGPIYTTSATADLLAVMLPDSAHIQEMEAERAKRRHKPKHANEGTPEGPLTAALGKVDSVESGVVSSVGSGSRSGSGSSSDTSSGANSNSNDPAYTLQDAVNCLQQLQPVAYDEPVLPHPDVRCRFRDAGHILGSAILEIWVTEGAPLRTTKLVMSGDLGQPGRPILRDPTAIEDADVLFIESTYGDRDHKDQVATMNELVQVLQHTLPHGNVVVPAFAVGRTQEVLYHLNRLSREGRLNHLNIYVDSPMAAAATRITMQHLALFDTAGQALAQWHAAGKNVPAMRFTASVEESMALNRIRAGAIIISASGMCNAGRIKHHLRHNLGRRECSVLITGFQAEGTLGRKLVDGAKRVSIFGEDMAVRAQIHTLGGFSAHAGQPALLAWAAGFKQPPRQTFVVHGEAATALTFADRLRGQPGWQVAVPLPGESFLL